MQDLKPTTKPPFKCILCGADGPFTSEEHIVPHSLGNYVVVLAKGWVCDVCNRICGDFESRAQYKSILGVERCRMGVITKKTKPAHSKTYGVSWFAEPSQLPNILSAEADWSSVPVLPSADGAGGKFVFLLHDETNFDIARLLLKIGFEILAPITYSLHAPLVCDLEDAKEHILGINEELWPYFVLRSATIDSRLVSVFKSVPEVHEYIQSCGFDIFLHQMNDEIVLFFGYGHFRAGIALTTRSVQWR